MLGDKDQPQKETTPREKSRRGMVYFLAGLLFLIMGGLFVFTTNSSGGTALNFRKPQAERFYIPTKLSIPSLELEAPVKITLVDESRSLVVPDDAFEVGWWSGSSFPGQKGTSIVVGHYDSLTGPGIFYELNKLEPSDEIVIQNEAGENISYTVEQAEEYSLADFPSEKVYSDTSHPSLRLITCSGYFDEKTKTYSHNLVVYASTK